MNKRAKVVLALCLGLVLGCLMLTGCGKEETTPTATPSGTTGSDSISFVAADKTNWDKEIAFGEKNYTLAITLNAGGTVSLKATEVGGSASFEQTGSWTYEKGYGYTVTVNGYTTKTSYDKASSRQIMYMEITNDGVNSGLVQFQAKDTAFRKEIAADYQDYEIRDAEMYFEYVSENNTNNPNSTHVYLEKDGTANAITYSGSSPTYKRGTWVKEANSNITVTIDGSVYNALYCSVSGKEGYRLTYNSNTMYTNNTAQYTDEDFEGKVVLTLQCEEKDYTLALTSAGIANLYSGAEKSESGTYTQNGDVLTVKIAGKEFVSENGLIEIAYEKEGDSCNTTTVDRIFATDGSVPVGTAKPAEENAGGAGNGENAGEGGSDGPAGEAGTGDAANGEGGSDGPAGEAGTGDAATGEAGSEGGVDGATTQP